MSITKQQREYAEARFAGLRKKDAALAAGCPEKTAQQAASRLEKHPNVVAHLARLKSLESDSNEAAGRDTLPPGVDPQDETFYEDPKDLLRDAMNDRKQEMKLRIQAATALLPYEHQKLGESGKKENAQTAASRATTGRFKPASAPQLSLIKN